MGGLRRISGSLMIGFGVLFVAWQLHGLIGGGAAGDGGAFFGAFVLPAGLILVGIQRLKNRREAGYAEEVVCPMCNQKKASGAACPRCGS